MPRRLSVPLALLGLAGACGRIWYEPVSTVEPGVGGAFAGSGMSQGGGGAGRAGDIGGFGGRGAAGGRTTAPGGQTGSGGVNGRGGVSGTGGGSGAAGGAAATSCSSMSYAGHSYAFCGGPASSSEAMSDCTDKGMRLVRIDDAAENSWVQMNAFEGITSTSSNYWSWIGGDDKAVTGEWRWSDGAAFWLGGANGSPQGGLYSNWAGGSPSNAGLATDCAILQQTGFWTDFDCTRLQSYVCERY